MSSLIESIKSRAYKLEFDDIGFCKAKIPKELSNHLKEFVYEADKEDSENIEEDKNTEENKDNNPNVFGNNSSEEDDINELRMSADEEYDIPSFIKRKN